MAGTSKNVVAPTKTELKKQAQAWTGALRRSGWDIVLGYDPERVVEVDGGYAIFLRAHS